MKTMDCRQTLYVLSITVLLLVDYSGAQNDIGISTGIIWKVKPYYYKEGNETKGIIAESFKLIKSGCKVNKSLNVENLNETVMLDSLEDFYNTFRDSEKYPYEKGVLKDVTSLSAKWLPVIQEFDKDFYEKRYMTEKTLFTEPKTAVVVKRDKIALFHKLSLGILQTKHILVLSFLSAIIFAILVWFVERWNNPEFGKSFTFGFGTGLWWAFVTMTTVGYGDVVPRSFLGRFLTIIWMILGLAAASLMTAAVSDVVLGVDYIDLSQDKVATIRDSYEANAIVRDYNSTLFLCNSYDEVVEAVAEGKAEAGVLPAYIAGSMMMKIYYELKLRVPFQLDLKSPVKMLYNPRLFDKYPAYVECVNTYFSIVFEMHTRKYKVFVQEETLYVESIADFYKKTKFISYTTIAIGALIAAGLLYDLIYWFWARGKKKREKRSDSVIIHNHTNFNFKENNFKNKNFDSGNWRNDELNKMRQDIMGIKENIMKINTLAKYKNPWY